MGKGGVGKIIIVLVIVLGLVKKGKKVYLIIIDLVVYLKFVFDESCGIFLSNIDEK